VRKDVLRLARERYLFPLETIASFYMKDSKGKFAKYTSLRLSKNHQVLQFGDPETALGDNSREIYFPLEIQVASVSLVEDRCSTEFGHNNDGNFDYHIWFFDKVHREGWDLITKNESDYVIWLKGLRALTGISNESNEFELSIKLLTDIEVEMRLYDAEVQANSLYLRPPTPPAPANFEFSDRGAGGAVNANERREDWRRCFAEVQGEDCFNFATSQNPLFSI